MISSIVEVVTPRVSFRGSYINFYRGFVINPNSSNPKTLGFHYMS